MRIINILLCCVFTFLFSKNKDFRINNSKRKSIEVGISGSVRDVISLYWDAVAIDLSAIDMN